MNSDQNRLVPKSSAKLPSIERERAAVLLAEDRYSDAQIAEKCGITERALGKWKKNPEFAARVRRHAEAFTERALRFGLARRERRLMVLTDVHDRLLSVIEGRAEDPDVANVPGGRTGLLVRQFKGVGKGEDFQIVEQYQVDTALVRELRGVQEQIARELGQWKDRKETVNLSDLFNRMSAAELEEYARTGTLPAWFTQVTGPVGITNEDSTRER